MNLSRLKFRLLVWLAPGLLTEVDRLRWITEAMHDIAILGLPYSEQILDMAVSNVREFEPRFIAGNADILERQASLQAAFRRMK